MPDNPDTSIQKGGKVGNSSSLLRFTIVVALSTAIGYVVVFLPLPYSVVGYLILAGLILGAVGMVTLLASLVIVFAARGLIKEVSLYTTAESREKYTN